MSDISLGIERRLSSFRLDLDGALAFCFTFAGLAAGFAASAMGM